MRQGKASITYIDTRKLFLLIIIVTVMAVSMNYYLKWTRVYAMEFLSQDLASSWQVSDPKIIKQVSEELSSKTLSGKVPRPTKGIVVLRLSSRREAREYVFTNPQVIFDVKKGQAYKTSKELNRILQTALDELRHRSPFGELLDWEDVAQRLKIGDEAQVRDLDSGKSFSMRRTGGNNHAEIEPIDERDSVTIKMLYGGQWSWKRRAVVVELNGLKIAGSLVGMPQGHDNIGNNGCNGSLGIFFPGRAVERSNNLSNLVMIWKAAGKTLEKLQGMSPEKTLLVLFTFLDQSDREGVKQMIYSANSVQPVNITNVVGITIKRLQKQSNFVYIVTASVNLASGPYNYPRTVKVRFIKDENTGVYLAYPDFLGVLLKPAR